MLTVGFERDDGSICGSVHFSCSVASRVFMSLALKFPAADRDRRGECLQGMCRGT